MSKRVVFIANSLDNAYKYHNVLMELDVEVAAGSTLQLRRLLAPGANADLVIFEAREQTRAYLEEICLLAENHGWPLLVIVDEEALSVLDLPTLIPSDFVMQNAAKEECATRIRRLLGEDGEESRADIVTFGSMTINLATYQVAVSGEPIDFTYLEYALLAFLVQHPNHTFTRDVLLKNVWGFDYYGGSRTVDVHVRRIRSKLGPNLAQHLETVRGVGYHWITK